LAQGPALKQSGDSQSHFRNPNPFLNLPDIIPHDIGSTRSLETAQKWIRKCDEAHSCMETAGKDLARRLLDLRNNYISLHETSRQDWGDKYACLFHCWGSDPAKIYIPTLSNLSSHKESIPWDRLPPTFQDAVSFMRRLGLDFMWIDSLCIVQDDERDWQQQSGDMANINQNGYITLAATDSSDASGGCYTRKEIPCINETGTCLAVTSGSDDVEYPIYARRRLKHLKRDLPLLQRGWVR
jgi:hypothetical protein